MKKLFLGVFLCIFLLSMINAAKPATTVQQITTGFIIEDSPQTILKQNQDYQYNFFVKNLSNGALKDDTTASCIFYLANSSGNVILFKSVPYKPEGYWGLDIASGNFSKAGFYNYGTRCNTSILAGTIVGLWEVTSDGSSPKGDSVIILFIILFLIIVGGFTYMFIISLGHGVNLDFDVKDLAINIGLYFCLIIVYYLQALYVTNQTIDDLLLILVKVGVWTNCVLPMIYFILTLTVGSWIKKRVKGVDYS